VISSVESSMMPDTAIEWVSFQHPFTLPGLERPHPPGTFEVRVRRELLDVSWTAYLLTRTIMLTDRGMIEALEVRTEDLAAALLMDKQ
jgi:hypothetical protein